MAWADWMVVEPSLEQELQLETDARAIIEDDDHKEIAKLCATLSKQNWYQQQIIKQSVGRISELEAMLACMEPVSPPKKQPWWSRILD
tara:strand:+ start:333 stop:596 length:264 start_codon:yes stop_codon:yes gene_type:complete